MANGTINSEILIAILVIIQIACFLKLMKAEKKSRRWGVRPINRRREFLGEYETLFQEMQDDEDYFFKYTRMNKECFNYLLKKVTPLLLKRSHRKPLSPGHRLSMTLKYLATGNDLFSIAASYRVGESTLRKAIQETCIALIKVLAPDFLKAPTREDWIRISEGFKNVWNLPNCGGAIDGKHITIKAPANSGSLFFNYKKTFSTVLMAVCDHEYKFSLVDVGSFGSSNDAGIFEDCLMSEGLFNGELNLPADQFPIPDSNITTSIFLVGDNIFPISTKLLKPYGGSFLTEEQVIFNYRLSRARRIVENAFGIMSSRWRILYTKISAHPHKVDNIVMTILCLHNFLMSMNNNQDIDNRQYCPPSHVDQEMGNGRVTLGDWRFDGNDELQSFPPVAPGRQGTLLGQQMRDTLATYFTSPAGEVPWQWAYIRRGQNQEV